MQRIVVESHAQVLKLFVQGNIEAPFREIGNSIQSQICPSVTSSVPCVTTFELPTSEKSRGSCCLVEDNEPARDEFPVRACASLSSFASVNQTIEGDLETLGQIFKTTEAVEVASRTR